jgi:hypothetical protein
VTRKARQRLLFIRGDVMSETFEPPAKREDVSLKTLRDSGFPRSGRGVEDQVTSDSYS